MMYEILYFLAISSMLFLLLMLVVFDKCHTFRWQARATDGVLLTTLCLVVSTVICLIISVWDTIIGKCASESIINLVFLSICACVISAKLLPMIKSVLMATSTLFGIVPTDIEVLLNRKCSSQVVVGRVVKSWTENRIAASEVELMKNGTGTYLTYGMWEEGTEVKVVSVYNGGLVVGKLHKQCLVDRKTNRTIGLEW